MDSAGSRFEAVREALADKKNILTVKELCELAGCPAVGITVGFMPKKQGFSMRQRTGRISKKFWKRTSFEGMQRASAGFICACCAWVCE